MRPRRLVFLACVSLDVIVLSCFDLLLAIASVVQHQEIDHQGYDEGRHYHWWYYFHYCYCIISLDYKVIYCIFM